MPKLSLREVNRQAAEDFITKLYEDGNLDSEEYLDAELVNLLRTQFKLKREDIAIALGIPSATVVTLFKSYDKGRALGKIPTGKLPAPPLQDNTQQALIKAQEEFSKQKTIVAETKVILESNGFEKRLFERISVPSKKDMSYIDNLYRDLKTDREKVKGSPETALATISDAHLCLENDRFNLAMAKTAVSKFSEKVITLTEYHRKYCPVSELVVAFIGDNIQGSSGNYGAQRWSVLMTAVDQAEVLIDVMVTAIEKWLLEYDLVTIIQQEGNHGNLYPKKTSIEPEHANIEVTVHRTVARIFKDNKRVRFFTRTNDWYSLVPVGGLTGLFMHGHHLDAGAGNFDGLTSAFRKLDDILPKYDFAVTGHFHRFAYLSLPKQESVKSNRFLLMNGTLVKGDQHSERRGAAHSNVWAVAFFNAERMTALYPVDLYD